MAQHAVEYRGISIRLACQIFVVSQCCYRYRRLLSRENQTIADSLLGITDSQRSWGFGLCYLYLRNVKGFVWNHKRIYRIHCELSLNMRIKPKKRLICEKPEPLSVPGGSNESWSMDFMLDQLSDGRTVRLLNIIDDFNQVVRTLEQRIEWKGKPASIRCDNRPEYADNILIMWPEQKNITLNFIQPGQPQQNAYIERYNRTVRYDWLGQHLFYSLNELQEYATRWQWLYNHERPNMALNGFTRVQHLQRLTDSAYQHG